MGSRPQRRSRRPAAVDGGGDGGGPVAREHAEHAEQGDLLPLFALALLVAAIVVWLARRRPALTVPAVVLAVVAGLAAISWTVVVGHSGAEDVWSGVVSSDASGSGG